MILYLVANIKGRSDTNKNKVFTPTNTASCFKACHQRDSAKQQVVFWTACSLAGGRQMIPHKVLHQSAWVGNFNRRLLGLHLCVNVSISLTFLLYRFTISTLCSVSVCRIVFTFREMWWFFYKTHRVLLSIWLFLLFAELERRAKSAGDELLRALVLVWDLRLAKVKYIWVYIWALEWLRSNVIFPGT